MRSEVEKVTIIQNFEGSVHFTLLVISKAFKVEEAKFFEGSSAMF